MMNPDVDVGMDAYGYAFANEVHIGQGRLKP